MNARGAFTDCGRHACAVLPADGRHSIPEGISLDLNGGTYQSAVTSALVRYTRGLVGTGDATASMAQKPSQQVAAGVENRLSFRLGIVCCKHDLDARDITR